MTLINSLPIMAGWATNPVGEKWRKLRPLYRKEERLHKPWAFMASGNDGNYKDIPHLPLGCGENVDAALWKSLAKIQESVCSNIFRKMCVLLKEGIQLSLTRLHEFQHGLDLHYKLMPSWRRILNWAIVLSHLPICIFTLRQINSCSIVQCFILEGCISLKHWDDDYSPFFQSSYK